MTDNRTTERVDHSPRVREAIDELMREKDATDNRTTELRISESLRGFIRNQSNRAYIDGGQASWLTKIADEIDAKHEQAVAATLGSDRDEIELIQTYDAGFKNGVMAVFQQLEGIESYEELQDLIAEYWEE